MKNLLAITAVVLLSACGSGDTGEGYKSTDTADLNTGASNEYNNNQIPAGDRGTPDSSIGATTNAKAPDSNTTNPNIRK